MSHHDGAAPERSDDERLADHAAIDRLADELLPALVAKLGASGLGELDVREGGWRVRLRMAGDARGARRTGSGGRGGRGEQHAGAPGHPGPGGTAHGTGSPGSPAGSAPGADGGGPAPGSRDPADAATRAVATSPAVGFFRPRTDLAAGARVRAGDRVGTVDVLGVPQEIVAPADGMVGASFVQPGDPVEYGQEIIAIELLEVPTAPHGEAG